MTMMMMRMMMIMMMMMIPVHICFISFSMKKHIENKIDPHFDLLVVIPPIKSFSRMVSLHNFQVPCVQFQFPYLIATGVPDQKNSPGS